MRNPSFRHALSAAMILLPLNLFPAGNEGQEKGKHAYVFASSHLDLFFTGAPPVSYSRDYRMFDSALALTYASPNFRYVIENEYPLSKYLASHPEKRETITAALKQGKLELAGQWCLMLQNTPTGEDLVRNILLATEFAQRNFGVMPLMQNLSDVPGQTPQAPQILSQSGLQGMIITDGGPLAPELFNWKGLDGSIIHVASMPLGYAGGYLMGLGGSLVSMEGKTLEEFNLTDITGDGMPHLLKQVGGLASVVSSAYTRPSDPVLLEVSWDNMMPPTELGSNIEAWNHRHGNELKLVPILPGEFFQSHFPAVVSVKTGEIPSIWADPRRTLFGGGYPQQIRTSFALLQAEKWASIAQLLVGSGYPSKDIEQAW